MQEKFSLTKSFLWIFLSTLVVSGSVYTTYFCYQKFNHSRETDPHYQIVSILQSTKKGEPLKCEYLAELMGLSVDKPENIYSFDLDQAEKDLLQSPLIESVSVKKIYPGTIFVDYAVREPVAFLGDYENIAMDANKYLFPVSPFFSPKKLPEVYLGLPPFGAKDDGTGREGGAFNSPLANKYIDLALSVFRVLERPEFRSCFWVKRIDVSKAFAESYGRREIVVTIEHDTTFDYHHRKISCIFPRILRLHAKEYLQQLYNYLSLSEQMMKDYERQITLSANAPDTLQFESRTVDLRIEKLAFVQED